MKNKKILYLLTIIITLFSYNLNVNAAQELTCAYEAADDEQILDPIKDMILIQDSKGNIEIYLRDAKWSEGINFEATDWEESDVKPDLTDKDLKKDSEGHLTACPASEKRDNEGNPIFFGTADKGTRELKENLPGEVKRPTIYSTTTETGTTTGETCSDIKKSNKMFVKKFDEETYVATCIYAEDVSAGCHIIQIDIKENGDVDVSQSEPREIKSAPKFTVDFNSLKVDTLKTSYSGWCPEEIYVYRYEDRNAETAEITSITTKVSLNEKNSSIYKSYLKVDALGKNLNDKNQEQQSDVEINFDFEEADDILNCEDLVGDNSKLIDLIKIAINLVKIGIPIALVGLGILDFAQAVFAGDEDKMKKALQKFIKRIIIGLVIFLIPSILKLILSIANSIWGNIDADLCGIL